MTGIELSEFRWAGDPGNIHLMLLCNFPCDAEDVLQMMMVARAQSPT